MTFFSEAVAWALRRQAADPVYSSGRYGVHQMMDAEAGDVFSRTLTMHEKRVIRETGEDRLERPFCPECPLLYREGESECSQAEFHQPEGS